MSTFSVELPAVVYVEFGHTLGNREIDLTTKDPGWLAWAIRRGVRDCITDALAGKVNTDEGNKAHREKYERVCVRGEIPTKGAKGGGGTSLEDKIATKFLTDMGHKGKLAILDERWMAFARITVLNSVDLEAKIALQKDLTQLGELALENLNAVKDAARASDEWTKIEKELTQSKVPKAKPMLSIKIGGK